jgi:hypothetical protein
MYSFMPVMEASILFTVEYLFLCIMLVYDLLASNKDERNGTVT